MNFALFFNVRFKGNQLLSSPIAHCIFADQAPGDSSNYRYHRPPFPGTRLSVGRSFIVTLKVKVIRHGCETM